MKKWKPLALGIAAVGIAMATYVPLVRDGRGVRIPPAPRAPESPRFDPEQSAALFVGVRRFTRDQGDVPYAADDAVDLAHMFALDPRVSLVPPHRVVIALSGRPVKEESKQRLKDLEKAGARVEPANQSDILALLEQQAAIAGKDGILIVSLATHGFIQEGVPHVLGASSSFRHPHTALPTPKMFEIAATSDARRSLIFVDACRERITDKTRAGGAHPATAAPLLRRMGNVQGQVVFYGAAAGQYAYDDDESKNGVFTKTIVDGLKCNAAKTNGFVTVETLRTYVQREVRDWIRKNRDRSIGAAIQISMDGDTKNMPLSNCGPIPSPPKDVDRVETNGSIVMALDRDGTQLWQRDTGQRIVGAEAVDLDADGRRELLVGMGNKIITLDRNGKRSWSVDERMTLRNVIAVQRFQKSTLQVVALWDDERAGKSHLSRYSDDGQLLDTYEHPGRLQQVSAYRPTKKFAPKLVAITAGAGVLLIDQKFKPLWRGRILPPLPIEQLEIVDFNNDRTLDISVSTAGHTFFLDVEGKVIGQRSSATARPAAQFTLVPR